MTGEKIRGAQFSMYTTASKAKLLRFLSSPRCAQGKEEKVKVKQILGGTTEVLEHTGRSVRNHVGLEMRRNIALINTRRP